MSESIVSSTNKDTCSPFVLCCDSATPVAEACAVHIKNDLDKLQLHKKNLDCEGAQNCTVWEKIKVEEGLTRLEMWEDWLLG